MIRQKFIIVLFLSVLTGFSFSQNKRVIDSLSIALDMAYNDEDKVNLLIKISEQYYDNLYDSAIIYADKALSLAEETTNENLIARANMQIGSCFFYQGNFNRVITYYYKVLRHYETVGAQNNLLTIYFNIGLIYDNLKDPIKAREYYQKSLNSAKTIVNTDSSQLYKLPFGRIYNNLGITYSDVKEYDKAIILYDKAIRFAQVSGKTNSLQFVYNNLGNVYRDKGEYDLALSFYDKSLEIRKKTGDIKGTALSYFYIGECYVLMKDKRSAIKYFTDALQIADSTEYLKLQRDVTEKLSLEYAKTNDFKNSYLTYIRFKETNDSLNYIESSRTATMLEMEYKFDKLKEQQENARKRRELVYLIIAIILFSVVCIVSLLYILARNSIRRNKLKQENLKLEKKQLKQELEFKNKELTTNVMYLFKKNELNNQVVEKLLNLKYELKKSNQKPLNDIILELQSSIDADVWEEFELCFQQVHESFYENLQLKFPDLTSNEKRLCAFLKLNMTTKEIAAITQKSLHSIDVARTRLRKKLNLTNTDIEISNFLAQM